MISLILALSYLSILGAVSSVRPYDGQSDQVVFSPAEPHKTSIEGPVMENNFPDPAIVKHNGVWYAFATNNAPLPRPHVQMASSYDFKNWKLHLLDPLIDTGKWSVGNATWSPSVIQRPDGMWVLYYTNPPVLDSTKHCIGVALASSVSGPYFPVSYEAPYICDLSIGGAIDPAAFRDDDGSYWLVYKVDGNSLGNGGACLNDIPPIMSTPIMLQRLEDDLITFVGEPIQLITNDAPEDGPDVEAPGLVKSKEGVYFLFYSSNCFTTPQYNVAYATATNIKGPYTRRGALIRTGDLGLVAPGAAGIDFDGEHIVFHANCPWGRCMYTGMLSLNGTDASI